MNDNDLPQEDSPLELATLRRRLDELQAQQLVRREPAESLLHDATQSLQESEARLQFVLEGSRLGFWDWNIVTGEVKRNAYWAEMLGYTPDEVDDATADGWLDLIHPDDRQRAWQSVEDNVAGRTTAHDVEYRMRARDGSYRWIQDRALVVRRDGQGRALRMSGTHVDVTARKQAEDSLREARDTLEQRVEERTAELTRAMQVLQAEMSKVEAGRLAVERKDCCPRRSVDEVLNLAQLRAEEKHLSLAAQYLEPLPATIVTDPVRLRQILVNLVGNAVKFTEVGGVQVYVSLVPGPPPQVCFAVQDTGIGMAPETAEQMFLPFTQADTSNTRRYGGSGLGRTISRRLADLIGGRITVSSQLGQGSTFTLILPLDSASQAAHPGADVPPESRQPRDLVPDGDRLCGRVLLAEDAADNREFLRLVLTKAGLEVDTVDNGLMACRQALASAAEGRPYDLILMDVQMPELNGLDATERLRQLEWTGPIVALTAHAMTGDRERCLAAGCDGYLSKPVAPRDLLATLARHLPNRDAAPGTG